MLLRNQTLRNNMVLSQLRPHKITNKILLDAMSFFDRADFFLGHQKTFAYVDSHIALKDGKYLLSPLLGATILQAANIHEEDTVLVLSSGTGYLSLVAACLSNNTVVGLEEEPELLSIAEKNSTKYHKYNVTFIQGSYRELAKYINGMQFSVVIVEGGLYEIPCFKDVLKDEGRLVAIQTNDSEDVSMGLYPHGYLLKGVRRHDQMDLWKIMDVHAPCLEAKSKHKFLFH